MKFCVENVENKIACGYHWNCVHISLEETREIRSRQDKYQRFQKEFFLLMFSKFSSIIMYDFSNEK